MLKNSKIRLLIVISLVIAMVGSTTFASAAACAENPASSEPIYEDAAAYVEEIIGIENVNNDITEQKDEYVAEGEDCEITIPKTGDEPVVMDCTDAEISMSLPEEVADTESEISDNGTVTYEPEDEDFSVLVQALSEEADGMQFEALRTLVKIENAEAPKKYSFDFNLPEGFRLVEDYDYDEGEMDEYDCGSIFIVNNDNEVISVIEPAWAKDANGEDVDTYYEINGNTLVQVVSFDENSAFPIVADPTYRYLYTNVYYLGRIGGYTAIGLATYIAAKCGLGAATASLISVCGAVIADGCKELKFRCNVYGASEDKYYYSKKVVIIQNKDTAKKYGEVTFVTKTRQK